MELVPVRHHCFKAVIRYSVTMKTKAVTAAGAALVVAVAAGAYVLGFVPLGGSPTGNMVKDAYELSTGSDLEVLKVEDQGSLDKITLSDGDNVLEAYVTSDGEYLVRDFVDLQDFTDTLDARNEFVSCLREQNAQFFGILGNLDMDDQQTQQAVNQVVQVTQGQIQILGGQNGLNGIYQGPGTDGFPTERVLNNGVVWRLNGEMVDGPQGISQLEEATGCTYDAPTGSDDGQQ
jgi:hypothetical protein